MHMRIGDVLPMDGSRAMLGAPITDEDRQWFILRTMSQREEGAAAKLERQGVPETWFPTETAWRVQRRAGRDRIAYERRIAPGYLFARFDREPIWDRLWEITRGFVIGVVGVHEKPYAVPLAVLGKMRLVPQRITILREAESARDHAARLARQPVEGGQATLTSGPLAGFVVSIERIDRGIAAFLMDGIRGTADVVTLERLA